MIGFELSEEQKQLQDAIHKFAAHEIRPVAAEYDRKTDPKDCVPWPLIRKALAMKLGAATIPRAYGGSEYGDLEVALIMEELAWGDVGFACTILLSLHATRPIVKYGSDAQKDQWLAAIAQNKTDGILAGMAFTEPGSGGDAMSPDPNSGIRTSARLDGNEYVLNGTKCFITNGGLAEFYVVWARTDASKGAPQGGLSVFIVPANSPGFTIGKVEDKMGQRLSQQAELIFDGCRIPRENILGKEGMGYAMCMDVVASSFLQIGAISIGLARAAFEYAYEYARSRVQGGTQIINHQAIAHKLADMVILIEAARCLLWKAAWTNDNIRPNNLFASMCKIFGSDMANRVAAEAVQIYGGHGYMKDNPVEKLLRDAKILQIYESGNETHRNWLVAIMQAVGKKKQ